MVVADSSVWIDYFNGVPSAAGDELDRLLGTGSVRLVVPDLVLFEVLRGFRHERDFRQARRLLETLGVEATGGAELALSAAQHYRALRAAGVTPRSSIDVLLAAWCIERDYLLLHEDRDFEPFEKVHGLRRWRQ
jgi:predicted nucleic acid-binding protein